MKFFGNPEVFRLTIIDIVLTAAFTLIAFFAVSPLCAAVVCAASVAVAAVNLIATFRRYRRISRLSEAVDRVLHHDEEINFADYTEGELAILQNELFKMTERLREQSESLKKDKIYLSELITDISHQLRTPLTSMNLIVSLLEKPSLNDEVRLSHTAELTKLLTRMDWLIDALLKMSKLDAGTAKMKKERIAVSALLDAALAPLAVLTDIRQQKVNVTCDRETEFTGDLRWQTEAVGNIIKNCIEHTGTADVIDICAHENAVFTEITVTDNGPGIDPADLPHLFDRFYKGKNSSETGIGVGLALARMIITSQNGTVSAENRREGGAKFTIRYYKGVI